MKKVLLLVSSMVVLASCGDSKTDVNSGENDSLPPQQHVVDGQSIQSSIPDGPYRENYPDGKIKFEGEIKNGSRFGLWKSYYPSGEKQSEDYFEDGKKNGKTSTFYKNGLIRYIGYYSWDKPSGMWEFYDTTGTVVTKKEYK